MLPWDVLHVGREPKRACRALGDVTRAMELFQERPRRELDGYRLILERTRERCDHGCAARAVLGMGCVSNPDEVSSVLDQHMLKATSSGNERDAPLARFTHDSVGRIRVAIWGARPDDDG